MSRTMHRLLSVCLPLAVGAVAARHPRDSAVELLVLHDTATDTCDTLTLRPTQRIRGLGVSKVYTTTLHATAGQDRVSFVGYEDEALWEAARTLCVNGIDSHPVHGFDHQETAQNVLIRPQTLHVAEDAPSLDLEPLIQSGDSSNRVDLVFFADGYLLDERSKFMEDALRLAQDVSQNQTFNTVKPLLNFWAAFTPSKESGIGVGGKPKDTAFGLYRDGTELRGVYYSKPEVARAACLSLGDQCDYPILMGNDPFYGGLGGEFTVITPSLANGPLVLRHELGHSVIDVGEEYDGGEEYFGVNAAQSLSTPVSWAHWLTNSSNTTSTSTSTAAPAVRSERAVMPLQDYAWTLLNTSSAWAATFSASGQYARHLVRFSLSGLPDAADLSVALDGEDLGWAPRKDIGVDRWHYDVYRDGGLSDAAHEVKFTLNNAAREGIAQLCSVEILEFGTEQEFNATPGHYSLYPTFSLHNATTFRPTNEDCLMRQVTTPNFCKVCIEGLWLSLLRRVDLIDDVATACGGGGLTAELALVPLAQFRADAVAPAESYSVVWTRDGEVLHEFTNQTRLVVEKVKEGAVYAVDVAFATEEVRKDKDGLLKSHRDIAAQDCLWR